MRDTSHTRALALSELIAMLGRAGLEVESVHSERLITELESWLASAQTPPDRATEVRRMLESDRRSDTSGMTPFVRDGATHFVQRIAALVCRKP